MPKEQEALGRVRVLKAHARDARAKQITKTVAARTLTFAPKARVPPKPQVKPPATPSPPPPVPLSPQQQEAARASLLKRRKAVHSSLPAFCKAGLLGRDDFVRLFYHCVFPALASPHQSSCLLLHLKRAGGGLSESWEEEAMPYVGGVRNVSHEVAISKLAAAVDSGTAYALRIVVEAPGSAHALLLLVSGKKAWLFDPNGDFALVATYFGSKDVLLGRLIQILEPLGCELEVPSLPALHHPTSSRCSPEYCRGGACTFVTGALAMRCFDGTPPQALAVSLAGSPDPPSISHEVDELVALTLAFHVLSAPGAPWRKDILSLC